MARRCCWPSRTWGDETSEAWRAVLDYLVKRWLRKPEFLIVDSGIGLELALTALWGDVPTQRCTVHKHRNLPAHAPSGKDRRKEIGAGLLRAMLRQLGLEPRDLE
jgi:transposase-like protein